MHQDAEHAAGHRCRNISWHSRKLNALQKETRLVPRKALPARSFLFLLLPSDGGLKAGQARRDVRVHGCPDTRTLSPDLFRLAHWSPCTRSFVYAGQLTRLCSAVREAG